MERLEEFSILSGFKFLEAYSQMSNCSDGTKAEVTTLMFRNDENVGIDVDIIGGEFFISERYDASKEMEVANENTD